MRFRLIANSRQVRKVIGYQCMPDNMQMRQSLGEYFDVPHLRGVAHLEWTLIFYHYSTPKE